jgi:predicted kinase
MMQYDNPNPFLVLVGAPGSGKSSWARRYFSRHEVVSSDRIRAMIGDHSTDQRANSWTFQALHAIVEGRTTLGKTVVVDATNRTHKIREQATEPARAWSRPATAVVFLTPLEVCLERNARRRPPRRVPEDWLRATHALIEYDFDPATMWAPIEPAGFSGVLFVRHDAHGYAGGSLTMRRYGQAAWMDCARQDPPDWFTGPEKWPHYHQCGWHREGRGLR